MPLMGYGSGVSIVNVCFYTKTEYINVRIVAWWLQQLFFIGQENAIFVVSETKISNQSVQFIWLYLNV